MLQQGGEYNEELDLERIDTCCNRVESIMSKRSRADRYMLQQGGEYNE